MNNAHSIQYCQFCGVKQQKFLLDAPHKKKLSHAKYADLELEADHIQLNGSRAESTARESHHNKH